MDHVTVTEPRQPATQWRAVSKEEPCPICRKPDWCSRAANGKRIHCRRTFSAERRDEWVFSAAKKDKSSVDYTIWIACDVQQASVDAGRSDTSLIDEDEILDPAVTDAVYSQWLDAVRRYSRGRVRSRRIIHASSADLSRALADVVNGEHSNTLSQVPGFYCKSTEWRLAAPPGRLVAVRNLQGQIVAVKIRPEVKRAGGKYIYLSSERHGGPSPGSPVHVPLHRNVDNFGTIRLTEGERKADCATAETRVLTLGLPGVAAFRKAEAILKELRATTVILAFDSDYRTNPHVARSLAAAIEYFRETFEVVVEIWDAQYGKGIDDVLRLGAPRFDYLRGHQVASFLDQLASGCGASAQISKPEIILGADEKSVNDAAIAALATSDAIYSRSGMLVQVLRTDPKPSGVMRPVGSPRIAELPPAALRETLSHLGNWMRHKHGRLIAAHPPLWSVNAVYARIRWPGVRNLESVVTGPVLRADGSVLNTAGYDASTGLYCDLPDGADSVPDKPQKSDVDRSVAALREVVTDFPFQSAVHEAAWFAYLLTLFSRFAFGGPAPLFLVDSNTQGSGKGLLCDVTSLIATGRAVSRMPHTNDDAEMRKRITSLAMGGDQLVLLDNIDGTLGGASLEAALTSALRRDRVLGRSEIVELPMSMVWCATGNNVALTRDMTRCVMHIRLRSDLERPEERQQFKHPNLLQWVRQERHRLAAAALAILRGFCVSGRPDQKLKPWGSFEDWSGLVRSAVVWAGLPDPCDARQDLVSRSDTETQALRALLTGLRLIDPDRVGLTVTDILRHISENAKTEPAEMVREALGELCPGSGSVGNSQSIGKRLRNLADRVVGGQKLDKRTRHNTSVWFVAEVQGEVGGDREGTSLPENFSPVENQESKRTKNVKFETVPGTPPTPPISPDEESVDVELF